jgi:hypothetical protein
MHKCSRRARRRSARGAQSRLRRSARLAWHHRHRSRRRRTGTGTRAAPHYACAAAAPPAFLPTAASRAGCVGNATPDEQLLHLHALLHA